MNADPRSALPSRRSVLHWMSAAALLSTATGLAPLRGARAAGSGGGRKLLTIFLRGGNDGLNTLIPLHDPQYFAPLVRPTLRIPAQQALDLGVGGAAFHPALARALEVYQAGELAAVARVGYAASSLSHFSSQRFVETGLPGDDTLDEGWVARWARLAASGDPLAAASVSAQLQRMYLGPTVLAHVPDLEGFALSDDPVAAKILGGSGSGLAGAYAAAGQGGYDGLVRSTGGAMAGVFSAVATLPPANFAADAFPGDPAACSAAGLPGQWWAASFLSNVRDSLRLLANTNCRVAGVEMPGFDHHVGQGGVQGDHADRLAVIAHALRSLRREGQQAGIWNELAVLVISEFGRTSRENGGGGTDHGRAGVALLAGGRVRGGVHHCDPVSWPANATLFSADNKYVAHRSDYRALLAEILVQQFTLDAGTLDQVLPGYGSLQGGEFQPLGLFL